jgi:hypothetical protein
MNDDILRPEPDFGYLDIRIAGVSIAGGCRLVLVIGPIDPGRAI